MARRFGQGELLAGGAATVALVVLVYALEFHLLLAIPLAVVVYLGLVLLRPVRIERRLDTSTDDTGPEQAAFRTALANAAAIRALEAGIADRAVREHVRRVADRIERTLEVLRDEGSLAAAPLFNDCLLELFGARLKTYLRRSTREIQGADDLIELFAADELPAIERAVDAFSDEFNRDRVLDLAALEAALDTNLRDITPPRGEPESVGFAPPTSTPPSALAADGAATGESPTETAIRQYGLTRRELDILILAAQHLRNVDIAEMRSISVRTVENHVASILAKTGLASRRQLPTFAARHGLLPPSSPLNAGE
jgi:DNA-binding NarL/FixJ family response regulator